MKMYVQTVGWFVFLTLLKNFSYAAQILFRLEDSHLTAREGSCIEIKCRVTNEVDDREAYWFWLKDADYINNSYIGTVIYSTNTSVRPVSPDFAGRVEYIGSPSSGWKRDYQSSTRLCSILICNLTKTDSGEYIFRFRGKADIKWATNPVNLTVTENPCPITFHKPPPAIESATVTLTCSTLNSCPSNPQIGDLTKLYKTQLSESEQGDDKQSATVSFTANWQDDGKELSCQTRNNKDPYLIRNISLTVEYAPKGTLAKINSPNIKEGDSVTLTCVAKGHPAPTFAWFHNEQNMSSEAEWKIPSIQDSQSGEYHCEARNAHGTVKSNPVIINVTYVPQVEVNMTSPTLVTQGDEITLTCNVKRSNPQPHTYFWFIKGTDTGWHEHRYVKCVEPEDSGFFTCSANNSAGTGISQPLQITVQYRPRKTKISTSISAERVKAGDWLIFSCNTDAYPAPVRYSWYRYKTNKQFNSSQWTSYTTVDNQLTLKPVQRADEACYMCNATNIINTGEDSKQVCIKVLYPPTNIKLSMDNEVMEGHLIVINCTVESSPPSQLSLKRTSASNAQSSVLFSTRPNNYRDSNTLKYMVHVDSAHAGFYTCHAKNTEGSKESTSRELLVKYRPNAVTVQARPSLTVDENTWLRLKCIAQSYPAVTSFTWMRMIDRRRETIQKGQILDVESVNPSDSGLYSCAATNEIGTGYSQQAEVKVKYAPKHAKITRGAEQHLPDGTRLVTLSCSSSSYPPVKEYSWYRKTKDEEEDVKVSGRQTYTVYSDYPGVYYCIAKNELDQRSSDPVELFVDRGFMTALKIAVLALITLLLIFLLFFVYRHKRNKSIQQGSSNTSPCFGFLGWWNCARRRNPLNEPIRSRDDLLPDQPCRLQAQRRQPRPDSTPAANINSVYCTVNLPAANRGPSAPKLAAQQGGHTTDESLNYASLHFGNEQQNEHIVYAMVSKQKQAKKKEPEKLVDYENVSAAHAARSPNAPNYDSDTSEDEVELNYSRVSFKAKAGHLSAGRESSSDSSTSDEDKTQYSAVKI